MSDLVTLASIGQAIFTVLGCIVVCALILLYHVGKYLNSQGHANRVAENQLRVMRGLEPNYGVLERWAIKRQMRKSGQQLNPTTDELKAVGVKFGPTGAWTATADQVAQIKANRAAKTPGSVQALTPQQRCATGAHNWVNSDMQGIRVCNRPGCSAVQDNRKQSG